jgi:hypothetical protein
MYFKSHKFLFKTKLFTGYETSPFEMSVAEHLTLKIFFIGFQQKFFWDLSS